MHRVGYNEPNFLREEEITSNILKFWPYRTGMLTGSSDTAYRWIYSFKFSVIFMVNGQTWSIRQSDLIPLKNI